MSKKVNVEFKGKSSQTDACGEYKKSGGSGRRQKGWRPASM